MKRSMILSTLAALALTLTGGAALAAPTSSTCTPTSIYFTDNNAGANGGYFYFTCSETGSTLHFVMVSPGGCSTAYAHSMESVKALMSLTQSALLAGKTITYAHEVCGSNDNVINVGLNK